MNFRRSGQICKRQPRAVSKGRTGTALAADLTEAVLARAVTEDPLFAALEDQTSYSTLAYVCFGRIPDVEPKRPGYRCFGSAGTVQTDPLPHYVVASLLAMTSGSSNQRINASARNGKLVSMR